MAELLGMEHGVEGHGSVKVEDLERLLEADGEAAVPIGRKVVPLPQAA